MKKIVNIWKESFPVPLLRGPRPIRGVEDRAVVQLAPGESTEVEDNEVSPELMRLKKKGRVNILTLETNVPPQVAPVEEDDEDIEKLEQELLADPDPDDSGDDVDG